MVHAWSPLASQRHHHLAERGEMEPSSSLVDVQTTATSKQVQQQRQQRQQHSVVTRRHALVMTTTAISSSMADTTAAAAAVGTTADDTNVNKIPEMRRLEERMRADNLNLIQPPFSISTIPSSTANGNSNSNNLVVYPSFLLGTWNVTQTLVAVSTPLGLQYAGGPNGIVSIGEQSIRQAKARLFQPVSLQLRFIPTTLDGAATVPTGGVVEDRLFNTRQRFNSFAGKAVVANVVYEEPRRGGVNAAGTVAASSRGNSAPLVASSSSSLLPIDPITTTTTVTYFKGPAAQKTFVTAHHDATLASAFETCGQTATADRKTMTWTGFECQRSLFALTNANTAPPIPTDSELLFSFTVDCRNDVQTRISGRLRIVGYLNPSTDTLYFAARNRAVTIQDYTLDMLKIA